MSKNEPLVIAIDGPSGTGKSSVSREVAAMFGIDYLDTGAMYRSLAWFCLDKGIDFEDVAAVGAAARDLPLEIVTDPGAPAVFVDGVDVSQEIRSSRVSGVVSKVAAIPAVREELIARQRAIMAECAADGGVVAEGRDITTVVAPDATVRILLTASEQARLQRRATQEAELSGGDSVVTDRTRAEVVGRDAQDSAVTSFVEPAPGVTLLDTTDLDYEGSVRAVVAIVASEADFIGDSDDDGIYEFDAAGADGVAQDADSSGVEVVYVPEGASGSLPRGEDTDEDAGVARALRAGLEEFDLDDADLALVDGQFDPDAQEDGEGAAPVVAVIGRPNVGKSTLVNRIIGRREAVVEDVPGVTRDRVAYDAEWAGTKFTLVDTGGWEVDATGIHLRVAEQAEIAVGLCDAVLFVVDATVGATDTDEAVVRLLRRSGKPVVLVANKVDDMRGEADAAALWSLGLGQPWPVSALHGRGTGDALEALMGVLPQESQVEGAYRRGGPRRVALLGRPNVGKSSLLNRLAGEERVVVDNVAGTTRDPVDEFIELGGTTWRFVDTAGIRRRVHLTRGADFYASLRTRTALEKAEVAVVLIDAHDPISEQDIRIVQQVVDAGRAVVIAYNKWDLIDEERRYYLEREIERELVQIAWAPRVNASALTGRHVQKLVPALEQSLASWDTRVPTGRLNALLGEIVAAHPHPVRGGKQPRILFATQASTRPPRFVLFANGFIEAGYRRFLERRLREEFGFVGSPIEISVRVKEKRRRKEK
ncbi:bifunctional cytidylate kinase/GTPase Der [Dermatophilus congolensis]|uniref:Multifunctional fusion protein n=1 Tax=Dermatophilus congolensis TaxID=1863 RepID=A0A239VLZ1_9MICO|nr:bifunctional cytidylate kinase/GTPase Der [Dermatophilus congolensis]MBO3140567.1 bifunctional cytidylate kinase/GTPase Der [Dermatophilus congolensis]MBO3145391.1 bifunctional cytidylate kinase/GTPase Der [Dermatophilus congolensis]MBO3147274.1 bifunctional cytidylate kinase/GTPase Der [Dermatophilus congolensis]MBO3149555.1 bifunctional cytidylate kinase/GTPase Der [Dermatophilus congolensis]MBO3154391.1 bifunctional cytidylate kinase/GTPase Der [Dermatophilus congolensis]